MEYLVAFKEIAVGCSALAAAYFAYKGLSTWQRELKGKSEYLVAKDVLRAVYEVNEAFKHVRNPAIYQYEYPKDMIDARGDLLSQHRHAGTDHVYQNRWRILSEAFRKLEEQHIKALVELGLENQEVIVPLRKCRVRLQLAIQLVTCNLSAISSIEGND